VKLVVLFASGIVAAVVVMIWRSRHGVEVWHAAADVPS
jgi:hypothetical protein